MEDQHRKLLKGSLSEDLAQELIKYLYTKKKHTIGTDDFEYYREWLLEAVNTGLEQHYPELYKKHSPFRDLYLNIKKKTYGQ